MAKKWLDSIEKQKKEKAAFAPNRQTDIHTDRQNQRQKIIRLLATDRTHMHVP